MVGACLRRSRIATSIQCSGRFSMPTTVLRSTRWANWTQATFVHTVRARLGFPIEGRRAWGWRARRTSRLPLTFQKSIIRAGYAFANVRGQLRIRRILRMRRRGGNSGTFLTHGTNYAIRERRSANFERFSRPITQSRKTPPTLGENTGGIAPGHPRTMPYPQRESAGFLRRRRPDLISNRYRNMGGARATRTVIWVGRALHWRARPDRSVPQGGIAGACLQFERGHEKPHHATRTK